MTYKILGWQFILFLEYWIYHVFSPSYEEALHPMGFKAVTIADNELAIEARKVH